MQQRLRECPFAWRVGALQRGLIDPGDQCAERVRLTFEQCNDAWIVRGMQRAGSGVDVDHGIGRMFTGTGAEIECSHGGRE